MQICPEFMFLPNRTFYAAQLISAESSTITGLFPPSSRTQGTRLFAAALATSLPFYDEPVKKNKSKLASFKVFATLPFP